MTAVAAEPKMPELKLGSSFTLPLDLVTEATAIVATRGAGKSSTGAVLVEETFAAGVPTVVFDWTGVFWGLRSDKSGEKPGLAIYVLGGHHGDVPLEAHAGALIADLVVDSGHSFVLDLSDFSKGQMQRFAADFLTRLYERKARQRTTILVVIDEAHEYAPQTPRGGFKGDSARLMGAMEQVVALGRSRGIGIVLITQRTQALNKAVLDLIETLLVMRMLSPRAVAAVKEWVSVKNEDDERGVLASLPELPTGTAWIWSPLRGILERVAIRRIKTFDSYETPKPGHVRVEPKARRELDLASLGEQMRETAERVKENDPSELRRRLRAAEDRAEGLEQQIEQWKEERAVGNTTDHPDWDTHFRELGWLNPDDADFEERARHILQIEPIPEQAVDLAREAVAAIEGLSERFRAGVASLQESTAETLPLIEAQLAPFFEALAQASQPRPAAPSRISTTTQRPPAPVRPDARTTRRPAPMAAPETGASGGATLNRKAERVVLAVLAQNPDGLSQRQLAIMAGYKGSGGGFRNALTRLRGLGYIEGDPAWLQATRAGIEAAGNPEPLPTGRALFEYWLGKLNRKAEREILQVLYDARTPLEPSEVAERTSTPYEPSGGGFRNAITKLNTLNLIEKSGGSLRAADILYG